MLPVVAGVCETKKQIIVYSALLLPLAVAPWPLGIAGPIYGAASVVLGLLFLAGAIAVWFDETDKSARRLFGFSILYLFALFGVLALDAPASPIGLVGFIG